MGEGGKESGAGEEGVAASATGMEGEGRRQEGGWKEGDTERRWENRGGQGEYAAQLMMSTSALESSGESMRGQVDHKVPN